MFFGIEGSLQTPNLCDVDWMMDAHEKLGDKRFFALLDNWLGKHDSSALFELVYHATWSNYMRRVRIAFNEGYNQSVQPTENHGG